MEHQQIPNKHEEVIEAAQAYYSGNTHSMADDEYDRRLKELKDDGYDIFKLINFSGDNIEFPHKNLVPLNKWKSGDQKNYIKWVVEGSLKMAVDRGTKLFGWLCKYDGVSIVAYYKNGHLTDILTKSSDDSGISKMHTLSDYVPHEVNPEVESIQYEAVVDTKHGFGEGSRHKAIGLVGSKYLQEEVDKYLTLVGFKVNLVDGSDKMWMDYANEIKPIFKDGYKSHRGTFLVEDLLVNDPIISLPEGDIVIDGYVAVFEDGYTHGFKFYYTSSVVTEVIGIDWGFNDWYESYSPVAQFGGVDLNGTNVQRCSYNGVNNLKFSKAGIGSEVRLIKSGQTIPKMIETLKESTDYGDHSCHYCGTPMDIDNVFGSTIKCGVPECQGKIDRRVEWFKNDEKSQGDFKDSTEAYSHLLTNFGRLLESMFRIERFNPTKASRFEESDRTHLKLWLISKVRSEDYSGVENFFEKNFYFTDLQHKTFKLNVKASVDAINEYINQLF